MIAQLQKHVRLWFLTAIALLAVVPPAIARDFTYEYEGQTLTYTVLSEEDKTCEVKQCSNNTGGNIVKGTVVIPEVVSDGVNNYTVTTIGENGFWFCSELISVELPATIVRIKEFAFYECIGLTMIEIPNSVTIIENDAFANSGLTSVKIPASVTTIDAYVFNGCSQLTSVELPNSVTSIGGCAFSHSGLTSIEIPNSVTSIESTAFAECSALTSIVIPSSVSTIGNLAFANCSALTSVVYNSDASAKELFSGCPISDFTFGGKLVPYNMSYDFGIRSVVKNVTITDNVSNIGDWAFGSCTELSSVEMSNSVTAIGEHAFAHCHSLTSIVIPNSITTIGGWAFYNCNNLVSMEIPNGVSAIGRSTFSNCTSLTSIEMPSSIGAIGERAFENCSSLTSIGIPDSVTTIGVCAFYGCTSLTSVEIPASVTTIGERAFENCSALTSVIYNSNATALSIFRNAPLTDLTFGGTTVPNEIANSHIELKTVILSDNIDKIEDGAFDGCDNIETFTFTSACPPEVEETTFYYFDIMARIIVPGDALTTYLDSAPYNRFYKWGTVEEPEGHSDGVFAYVFTENPPAAYLMADESYREAGPALTVPLRTNKETTIYPIKGILPGAFHYCTNLNSVKIGNNVELIGYNAFENCNALTSVEIPNSVITIGGGAFSGCSGLTSIEIPNSVISIGYNAFSNCYGLTSLEIPNSVATIGYGAFENNYNLTELTLGSGLKTIGTNAFRGCTGITDVVIPPFVTEIGASAFAGTGLKTVKIGCRVTSIGANAFAQVNDMTGIYVTAMAPPTAENTSFSNYSMPLYVVPGTISLYENASPCWYRFYDEGSISEQTPVTEVTVEDMLLAGAKPGDTFQIKSGVVPAEATLPHLFYVSSNPDVVQVTHEGLVTIMEPQATNDEEIETYSYREPADVEIRVYSMYDDVAPAVIKFDISTGVDDIVIGDASGEIDRSLPYEVYNLNGQMVGTDRSNLANGIYIVRQGSKVQKIAVK